jgi:DNA-binding IclR family transcriptional regulator
MGDGPRATTRSVLNSLRVLECFSEEMELGVSELSRRLELPKATVQRCLVTLGDAGWLERTDTRGRWQPGTQFLAVSSRIRESYGLNKLVRPALETLRDMTSESVHFTVLSGAYCVALDRLESPQPVRAYTALGQQIPAYASAGGKAMLAWMPPAQVRRLVPEDLRLWTENTHQSLDALLNELEQTRQRGFAVNLEEYRVGVRAVGAPIVDRGGLPLGALVVSAPAERFHAERLREVGHLLVEVASGLRP